MTSQTGANLYTQGYGTRPENVEIPHIDTRIPSTNDVNYPIGKRWIDTTSNSYYTLTSISASNGNLTANWQAANLGSGTYPLTPYVVGPVGQAGYQTIQGALDAANAAGGGTVYVQFGNYTENLTLYNNVDLRAVPWTDASYVTITGQHTPPSSGTVQFEGFTLIHASAIFNDSSSKTLTFNMINTLFNVTSGTSFNIPNFAGTMNLYDCVFISADDSIFNNSSGSMIFEAFDCALGIGTSTGTIQVNGNVLLDNSIIWPVFSVTGSGTIFPGNGSTFHNEIVLAGSCEGSIYNSQIISGASPALTMSSSGNVTLSGCVIDSSNNPSIDGVGAGTLTLGGNIFSDNSSLAATLTLAWSPQRNGAVSAGSDVGGPTGTISLTNANSTTISTGVGSVKMSSTNAADNTAWIKIYIDNTAYWIPAWTTNSP